MFDRMALGIASPLCGARGHSSHGRRRLRDEVDQSDRRKEHESSHVEASRSQGRERRSLMDGASPMSTQRLMSGFRPRDCQSANLCGCQHESVVLGYSSMGRLMQTICLGGAGPTGDGRPASELLWKMRTQPKDWN